MKFRVSSKRIFSILLMGMLCLPICSEFKGDSSVFAAEEEDATDYSLLAENTKQELEKKASELLKAVELLEADKSDMALYVLAMDETYESIFSAYQTALSELPKLRENVNKLEEKSRELKALEQSHYEILKNRIKNDYENGGTSIAEIVLGNMSLTKTMNLLEYRMQLIKYDKNMYSGFLTAREEAEEAEERAKAELATLEAYEAYCESTLLTLEQLAEKKSLELKEMAAGLGLEEEAIYMYWAELYSAESYDDEFAILDGERLREQQEAERLAAIEASKYELENIIWPLPGRKYISSHFGTRDEPTAGAGTYHKGTDIPARTGEEVHAALSGTVVAAKYDSSSGYYVKLSHGNGVYTVYCHASKLLVSKGDEVRQGDVIMLVGNTGISTGSHLHFGLIINGTHVDAMKYVSPSD